MNTTITKPLITQATPDIHFCNCCNKNEVVEKTGATYYEIDFGGLAVCLCDDCIGSLLKKERLS